MKERAKALNPLIIPISYQRKRMSVDLDYAGSGPIIAG
jgi:hypothetical protein